MLVYLRDTFLDFLVLENVYFPTGKYCSFPSKRFHFIAPSTMYEYTSFITTLDSLLNEMLTPNVYPGFKFLVVKAYETNRLMIVFILKYMSICQ